MKFKYRSFRGRDYPIVEILLKRGSRAVRTQALVDSGASLSLFNSQFLDILGLELSDGETMTLEGLGGRIAAYIHEVGVVVARKEFRCRLAFSNELNVAFNILGRDSIFRHFTVCFDESRRGFELC